jgi:hypothetical protein
MLSSIFLLLAPFLLVAPASAAPRRAKLQPRDGAESQCVGVTVTVTATAWEQSLPSAPASPQGIAVSPTAVTEKFSPATSLAVLPSPHQDPQPSLATAPAPEAPSKGNSPSVPAEPQAIPIPEGNATAQATQSSSYRNSLYFTNWYATSSNSFLSC